MSDKLKQSIRLRAIIENDIIGQYYHILNNWMEPKVEKLPRVIYWNTDRHIKYIMLLYKLGFPKLFAELTYHDSSHTIYMCHFNKTMRGRIFSKLSREQLMELAHEDKRFGCESMYQAVIRRDMATIEKLYDIGIPLPKVPFKELNIHESCGNDYEELYDDTYNIHRSVYPQHEYTLDNTYSHSKVISVFNQDRIDFMGFLMRNDMILYDTNTYSAQTEYYNSRDNRYSMLEKDDSTEFIAYALDSLCRPVHNECGWGDDTDTVIYFAPSDFTNGNVEQFKDNIGNDNNANEQLQITSTLV